MKLYELFEYIVDNDLAPQSALTELRDLVSEMAMKIFGTVYNLLHVSDLILGSFLHLEFSIIRLADIKEATARAIKKYKEFINLLAKASDKLDPEAYYKYVYDLAKKYKLNTVLGRADLYNMKLIQQDVIKKTNSEVQKISVKDIDWKKIEIDNNESLQKELDEVGFKWTGRPKIDTLRFIFWVGD